MAAPDSYGKPRDLFDNMKRDCSRVGWAMLILLVVTEAAALVLGYGLAYLFPGWYENDWLYWAVSSTPLYLFAFPCFYLCLRRGHFSMPQKKEEMTGGKFLLYAAVSLGAMYLFNILSLVVEFWITMLKGSAVSDPLEYMSQSSTAITVVFAVILAPVMEELMFRRFILGSLQRWGNTTAILGSALLFGLFHGNISQFFYAFGLGAIFGYTVVRFGTIRYCILLHGLVNLMGSVVLPALLSSDSFLLAGLVSLAVLALMIVSAVLIAVRVGTVITNRPPRGELSISDKLYCFFVNPGMILFIFLSLLVILLSTLV